MERLTLLVGITIYSSWAALTYFHDLIPLWLLIPLGGLFVGWHGSFQHEAIHGHPTKYQLLNDILAFPPLGLVYAYPVYKETHSHHHTDHIITDPIEDPESFYVTPAVWERSSLPMRALLTAHNTLVGRLLLGPWLAVCRLATFEITELKNGTSRRLGHWLWHIPAVIGVFAWVSGVCGMPVEKYILCFAYPGLSVILLRSFAKHRPAEDPRHRSVSVEAGLFFRVLFLGNNYHFLHHLNPSLAWYRLKPEYEARKESLGRANGGYVMNGYSEVFRRYAFTPKDLPVLAPHASTVPA